MGRRLWLTLRVRAAGPSDPCDQAKIRVHPGDFIPGVLAVMPEPAEFATQAREPPRTPPDATRSKNRCSLGASTSATTAVPQS